MSILRQRRRVLWLLAALAAGSLAVWLLRRGTALEFVGPLPKTGAAPFAVRGGFVLMQRQGPTTTRVIRNWTGTLSGGTTASAGTAVVSMAGPPVTVVRRAEGGPERTVTSPLAGYQVARAQCIAGRLVCLQLTPRVPSGLPSTPPALAVQPIDGGPARVLYTGPEAAAGEPAEDGGNLYWVTGFGQPTYRSDTGWRGQVALWRLPSGGGRPVRLAAVEGFPFVTHPPVVCGATVYWIATLPLAAPRGATGSPATSTLWSVPTGGGVRRKVDSRPGWGHDLQVCDGGVAWWVSPQAVPYALPTGGAAGGPPRIPQAGPEERRECHLADGSISVWARATAGARAWHGRVYWIGYGFLGKLGATASDTDMPGGTFLQSVRPDGSDRRPIPGPRGDAPVKAVAGPGFQSPVPYRGSLYVLMRRQDDERDALYRLVGRAGAERLEEVRELSAGYGWSMLDFDEGYCYLIAAPETGPVGLWRQLLERVFPRRTTPTLWRVRLPVAR